MSEPEDLEARVTELEGEVADLNTRVRRSEQDAAAARVLAGGADRDVADLGGEMREFRAEVRGEFANVRAEFRDFRDQNNRVLNVMREDLVDLRSQTDARFAQVDDNFIGIRGRLDDAAAGQQQIVHMLTTLIERQDGENGP